MGKGQLNARSYKRLSYLFVIWGIVFFLVGLWKFIGYFSFIGTSEKVDAVVVEVYVDRDNPADARLLGNNLYQACVMMIMLPIFWIVARICN